MKPNSKSVSGRNRPAVASLAALLTSSALLAILAPPASAVAQEPPTYSSTTQWGLELIGAPVAWAYGYTGAGVTVTVGDTGIDTTHPAFTDKINLTLSKNYVLPYAGASYDSEQITDLEGHGTHVSGIIAASASSKAPGVAYDANLVMLRVLTDPDCANGACEAPGIPDATASSLLDFATFQDVRIYNASYGPTVTTKGLQAWPQTTIDSDEEAAALKAISQGKIIVAAAGNARDANPIAGQNPSGLALDPFIRPGVNANAGVYIDGGNNFDFSNLLNQSGLIIAVTSVDKNKNIVNYAQTCGVTASWCVAAPGGDSDNRNINDPTGIYSTIPLSNKTTATDGYGFWSGTSMAAPMVSGALAVLSQAYPAYDSAGSCACPVRHRRECRRSSGGQRNLRLWHDPSRPGDRRTNDACRGRVRPGRRPGDDVLEPAARYGRRFQQDRRRVPNHRRTDHGGRRRHGERGGARRRWNADPWRRNDRKLRRDAGRLWLDQWRHSRQWSPQCRTIAELQRPRELLWRRLAGQRSVDRHVAWHIDVQWQCDARAGAQTRVNVDGDLEIPGGPGTYDKIIVEGASHIFAANGVLAPILRNIPGGFNTYDPTIGSSFPFLTASSGASVAGSFTGLSQPVDGLPINARFDLVYSPTSITLDVTPKSYLALAAMAPLNPNQQALAAALDRARPPAGPALTGTPATIFYALYGQETVAGDASALSAMSGQGQAAAPAALLDAYADFSNVIANRQAMLLAGLGDVQAALTPNIALSYASGTGVNLQALADASGPFAVQTPAGAAPRSAWTAWGEAYGGAARVGDLNGVPGSEASSGGFAVGADGALAPDVVAGGALGYTSSSTNSGNTTATGNTYAGALYATWTPGSLVFDGRLAAGPSTGGASRGVTFPGESVTASSSMNGWGELAAADAGYRFDLMGSTFKPFVGLTGQTFSRRAFTETSDFGLSFPSQSFDRATSEVGLWATRLFHSDSTTYMLQAKASWTNDFGNQGLTTQAALLDQPFTIAAANPGGSAAVIAVNFAAWRMENVAVFFQYQGEFRSNATSNQGSVGVRMIW